MLCDLFRERERSGLSLDATGRAGAVDPWTREWAITSPHLSVPPSLRYGEQGSVTHVEFIMVAEADLSILRHQDTWAEHALSLANSEPHFYPPPHSVTSNFFGSIVFTFVSVILVTFQSLTGCLNNFFLVLLQSLTGVS